MQSKYSIEIYTPSGVMLAELSGRAKGRRFSKGRNDADDIQWSLDLKEFDRYCREQNIDANEILYSGRNEVRIKRGSTYLAGGKITYVDPAFGDRNTIDVRASGFLNLLGRRSTSKQYAAVDGVYIAWDLIAETQAEPYGDIGITKGVSVDALTVGLYNKTYARESRKDALVDLSESQTKGFDFEIKPNKTFEVYSQIGVYQPDILFEFPGNIISGSAPVDATRIVNDLTGIGSGNGNQAGTVYPQENIPSKQIYGLTEDFLLRSSTDNSDDTLKDAVDNRLAAAAFPRQIPAIVVDGGKPPFITDYGIGDRVHIRINGSTGGGFDMLKHIDGFYRIEKYSVAIDDDDKEIITIEVSI
jgi:hypothetical protein